MAERVGLPRYRDAMRKCRCADVFNCRYDRLLRSNPWPFGLGFHPTLSMEGKAQPAKQLHFGYDALRTNGGSVRRLVDGSFFFALMGIGALDFLHGDEYRLAIDRHFV